MIDTVQSFAWRFGGPLAGLPPALAWTLLGAAGLGGAAWIVASYRRTLVVLTPRRRAILGALRLALWAVLLVALAGPTRVERTFAKREARPLAVLVDRSASMTTPDNRHRRRLDDALRHWQAIAPAAARAFGETKTFAFADGIAAVSAPDAPTGLPAGQTKLFAAVQHVLADAPSGGWGGVVLLTDGLDTTGAETATSLDATARQALAEGTPLFPVPGRNRYAGGSFLTLRDLVVPSQVPPHSRFRIELAVDSFQPATRNLPVRLRVGEVTRELDPLPLAAGRRMVAWGADIDAELPGVLPIELRLGEGEGAAVARAEVRVAAPETTRILYYQGALDWGYRFLADILHRDPAFTLEPIFNLTPASGARRAATAAAARASLPDTIAGFDAYDVVVLSNSLATQFTAAQQSALSGWVRGGGVLLFLAPDDASTQGFAGTELEKMLPVVFAPPADADANDPRVEAFRQQMREVGGANNSMENTFSSAAAAKIRTPELAAFAWEPRARVIFGNGGAEPPAPLFLNYARVARAKPGADVLARHPRDLSPSGDEHAVLLAIQRYGRGQSAVLTSDALWRWKLNQSSRERGVEEFWQTLFAWLGRERPRGPRFEQAPLNAVLGREVLLRTSGSVTGLTVANDGDVSPKKTALAPQGEEGGTGVFSWTPPAAGVWAVTATDSEGRVARHWITVSAMSSGETSGLPPDEGLLAQLAERTGGMVLGETPPPAWLAETGPEAALVSERRAPLWHAAWLLGAILGLYAAELLLRRRWQLL